MNFLKRLFRFSKDKNEQEEKGKQSSDLQNCPFCWGYQEYGSATRIMTQDKQIDVKNHKDKYVKVGKFMVEHVDGFKNKKRIVERCPRCGGKRIRYKENPK